MADQDICSTSFWVSPELERQASEICVDAGITLRKAIRMYLVSIGKRGSARLLATPIEDSTEKKIMIIRTTKAERQAAKVALSASGITLKDAITGFIQAIVESNDCLEVLAEAAREE